MSITSRGAAVPEPPDDGSPHHAMSEWYHKKNLTAHEQHVADKYFEEQRREAAKAKRAARSHRGVDLPAVGRDGVAKFTMSSPRLDWMNLDFDLSVKEILALDEGTDQWVRYSRSQSSADDECLWVDKNDLVTPEGHSSERLMEMWPDGFQVTRTSAPGFEPPHSCPPKPAACPYCRAMKRTES